MYFVAALLLEGCIVFHSVLSLNLMIFVEFIKVSGQG